MNIAPPLLALLLLLAAGGCTSTAPSVEYDRPDAATLRSKPRRARYVGPESVELVENIEGRREELAKVGHVVLASGSLLVSKGDGVEEITKLGKSHGAAVVLFAYLAVGAIDRIHLS